MAVVSEPWPRRVRGDVQPSSEIAFTSSCLDFSRSEPTHPSKGIPIRRVASAQQVDHGRPFARSGSQLDVQDSLAPASFMSDGVPP